MQDSTASALEVTAVEDEPAFKTAEKRYQQRKVPLLRRRGARFRQVGHTVLPTDLSPVIDARSRVPACRGSKNELVQLYLPAELKMSPVWHGLVKQEGCGPFALQSHPGCIVFPGWLTPEAQLQIASDAFSVFPDAPAKTNHSARFGNLAGLWEAAQAEKVLQRSRATSDESSSTTWEWVDTTAWHLNKKGDPRPGVVTAKRLWQGLRWSTLGPAYDWTLRRYHPDQPHRPLPPYLRALALHFAQLADAAVDLSTRAEPPHVSRPAAACPSQQPPSPGSPTNAAVASPHPGSASSCSQAPSSVDTIARPVELPCQACCAVTTASAPGEGAACSYARSSCDHDTTMCHSSAATPQNAGGRPLECAACCGVAARPGTVPPFNPDAAIVNYYRGGDTLNGHQDDVEEDVRQPIVSVSVGCDAVFLIGGRTKAVAPTALLLGSGDVVVMRSDARLSFHGVPRVLDEHDLPAELMDCDLCSGAQVQALAEMTRCRVNVSLRHTSPLSGVGTGELDRTRSGEEHEET